MLREILPVYVAAEAEQMYDPFYWPDKFVDRLERMYAPSRGFEMVVGRLDGKPVGFAFGTTRERSKAVWDAIGKALPDVPVPEKPEPVFLLCEINVQPNCQGRGYGRALHDALLASRRERLAFLLVHPDNPARFAYASWGWRKVGEQQPFPDSPVFDEMVRELPLQHFA